MVDERVHWSVASKVGSTVYWTADWKAVEMDDSSVVWLVAVLDSMKDASMADWSGLKLVAQKTDQKVVR